MTMASTVWGWSILSLCLLLPNSCHAFGARLSIRPSQRTHIDILLPRRQPMRRQVTTATAMPVMFRELSRTIYTILVPPPPPPPSAKIEGAELFRFLGVPPTADYDEVQAAVIKLKEKYAGDKKKLMQIDVTKDKIAELRLRQRMRGTLAVTSDVAYLDRQERKRDEQSLRRSWEANKPRWVRRLPYMWIPPWEIKNVKNFNDRKWAMQHVKRASMYWLFFAFVAVFFPRFINQLRLIAPFLFLAHLAQRGRPPPVKTDDGMFGEVRDPVYGDYLWAAIFVATHGFIGLFVGDILAQTGALPLLYPRQTRFLFSVAGYYVADILWQPHLVNRKI